MMDRKSVKTKKSKKLTKSDKVLYTFEVFLISGPMDDEFIDKNPVISRTMEIRGTHTLEDLHNAIFRAFDREEEHMYEFQIGGDGPNDPKAECYESNQTDTATTIELLGIKEGDIFGYWFDFGDDWWHQINLISVSKDVPKGKKYPKITKKVGKSPPQYSQY
ncbi:MAG: hypothetical protein B6245_10565 [Desulfobacteraceae bacterium 4572_88]|nr:MAG: hypothetical protein B6245_10565 [Desulfobacteraceae bacterium 4572_88]